ncbi:hypothetical protein ASE25_17380 [Terrabacter sp. Root85]|nr:hypothetical protein ASE25_17380 [Terrabacter sp. Root85]
MSSMDPELDPSTPLRCREFVDELTTDEGTLVLVGGDPWGRVVRLSPLGLEILDAIGAGLTLQELEAELLDRMGEPPGGQLTERVRESVLALLSAEVISAGQGTKETIGTSFDRDEPAGA